jgi:hypothetical protein
LRATLDIFTASGGAKDLKIRNLRSFAVYAAQDDEWDGVALSQDHWAD